eukprot:TRINITY_DN2746_c0_g1_i2.p1 TRINITY_DN2746_c0_g1~~TRINITY_DN2746_c0_g1_i2.p1  ORF type:complete len:238 (-),score=22.37 TRINITY_DN2746_c0_g1_i2:385-1098(-)
MMAMTPDSTTANPWTDTSRLAKIAAPITPVDTSYSAEFPSLTREVHTKVRANDRQRSNSQDSSKRPSEDLWSSDGDASPSSQRSPPSSPVQCPRRVQGMLISPQPIESPRAALRRWVGAGRPPPLMYKCSLQNEVEWKAFKRAVKIAAHPPHDKRVKVPPSDDTIIGSRSYAAMVLQQTEVADQHSDVDLSLRPSTQLPPSMAQPAIVQTFTFGTICATQWSRNHIPVISCQHAISA